MVEKLPAPRSAGDGSSWQKEEGEIREEEMSGKDDVGRDNLDISAAEICLN